jgi:aminoglycoside phosphotransferase (APT) family kinase protein
VALPKLRRTLLNGSEFPVTLIHGDAHPGNALLRGRSATERTVLLDWGRARAGSPLEDVASWLQSLGYWEPEAKRRHDTLFRRYLESRAMPPELTRSLRDHYWLAGMCNILSGSLRYHLWVAGGGAEAPSSVRAESLGAARDQLRVIRRADILWRHVITA